MGGPLKLKFANNFIIYQKRPLRGRLGLAGYTQCSWTEDLRTFCTLYFLSVIFLFQIYPTLSGLSSEDSDFSKQLRRC